MTALYVSSFCWCLGLEVGAKLVGFLHLAVAVSLLVVCSVFAQNVGAFAGTIEDAEDHVYTTWYKIAIAATLISVGHVLLALTLLYGVFNRATAAVRVWVYVMCVMLAAALAYLVVTAAVYGVGDSGSVAAAVFQGLALFGCIAYAILAVYSYLQMLLSSEQIDSPQKVDY